MKIMTLYNTRGMLDPMFNIRKRHLNDVDFFIHLGNSMINLNNEALQGYLVFEGEYDFKNQFLKDYLLEINNLKLLFISKAELERIYFSNTYQEYLEYINNAKIIFTPLDGNDNFIFHKNILYISPGDLKVDIKQTYRIIEIRNNLIIINVLDYLTGQTKEKINVKI